MNGNQIVGVIFILLSLQVKAAGRDVVFRNCQGEAGASAKIIYNSLRGTYHAEITNSKGVVVKTERCTMEVSFKTFLNSVDCKDANSSAKVSVFSADGVLNMGELNGKEATCEAEPGE